MTICSQPNIIFYPSYTNSFCYASSNTNSTSLNCFSPSFSTLHAPTRTHFPNHNFLSLTKIHAKFDKFDGENDYYYDDDDDDDDDVTSVQLQDEIQEELKVEDDDCLPSNLEGAVRQSGEASASFVDAGGMRAIVELLIPQLQFLDDEGAQAELWELSRLFIDTLIEETGCQRVKAIFPDTGAAALLKYKWKDAAFGFSSLSDRKPVEDEDEIVVMVVPDYQMLEYVQKISALLSDDPISYTPAVINYLPHFSNTYEPRPLVMWNPRLISEEVGVGVNIRNLKRYFLRTFSVVYSMKPLASGAVFRCYPGSWKVFYDDKERQGRYLLAKELISRPDSEELEFIFGGVQEKTEEGPSLLAWAGGIFSSINRFMKAI